MVVYETIADEFNIGHCLIKVKGASKFSPLSTIQTVIFYISSLEVDWKYN